MIHTFIKPGPANGFEINVSAESHKIFQELVQRATNLWPDAPAQVKLFADIITNGKPMQNYLVNPNLAGKYAENHTITLDPYMPDHHPV